MGEIVGAIAGIAGQQMANQANVGLGREQMAFQEHMSNTAHVREVADLRNAGLNPILSATGGQGASTPPGSSMHVDNVIGAGVTGALDALQMKNEIQKTESQVGLNQAAALANAASATKDNTSAKNMELSTKILEAQAPTLLKESNVRGKQADWDSKAMDFDNFTKRAQSGLGLVNSAKDVINPFKGLFGDQKSGKLPPWQGQMKDGTVYNKGTGEIVNKP